MRGGEGRTWQGSVVALGGALCIVGDLMAVMAPRSAGSSRSSDSSTLELAEYLFEMPLSADLNLRSASNVPPAPPRHLRTLDSKLGAALGRRVRFLASRNGIPY